MKILLQTPFINQRMLAEASGHSLGVVNRSVKDWWLRGIWMSSYGRLPGQRKNFRSGLRKERLSWQPVSGCGWFPSTQRCRKDCWKSTKEPLIERQIRQLHEVGIREIYVVVGFMKERYEYLIDEFGVELVVNPDYMTKNNLHSVRLVRRIWRMRISFPATSGVTGIPLIGTSPTPGTWSVIWWKMKVLSASTGKWNWSRFRKEMAAMQ